MELILDHNGKTPIYKQILHQMESMIRSGEIAPGTHVPSMNDLAAKYGISRETVKKTYGILAEAGLLEPRHGKGFYVTSWEGKTKTKVLVLFDRFSIYKQVVYGTLAERLGDKADITVLDHGQNPDLLEYFLDKTLDEYDYYIISPHFPLDEVSQARGRKQIQRVPNRKLIMVDRIIPDYPGKYGAVYQDFEKDVKDGLMDGLDKLRKASSLKVITLPTSLYGAVIRKGIESFCYENYVPVEFLDGTPETLKEGETYLILNSQLDWGLADLARKIKAQNLSIGKDVSIIGYNDVYLNEVVLGGLTTISTDFELMGKMVADMILEGKMEKIHCPFRMTHRNTF